MSDIEKVRHLFEEAGLKFPNIPPELAAALKERGKWRFSTFELEKSPYNLQHYVQSTGKNTQSYVVLAHSGHGVNSYAIQYYLVTGPLRLFLHLSRGGVYMDRKAAISQIRECFSLADEILTVAMKSIKVSAKRDVRSSFQENVS